jgi:Trypsin-like peptidase domain
MTRGLVWLRAAGAALAGLLLAGPAAAVLIGSGDGSGNTSAPPDDPGFAHAGVLSNNSAVYLGDGWVLTANHVSTNPVTLGGIAYPPVAASAIRLEHAAGVPTDLKMFRLVSDPGLAPLPVASSAPLPNEGVVMMGHGRDRGAATSWNGIAGFSWASNRTLRWGTNRVTARNLTLGISDSTVRAFSLEFDDDGGATDEAHAVTGDSGGPVFTAGPSGWELAGVIFASYAFVGQPAATSLFGNGTYAADLSYYRDQIEMVRAERACDDGVDDDGDGLVDGADPGCANAADAFETNALVACDDGFDDDGDGLVDWPADPGCKSATSLAEDPQCDDDIDNDGDGRIDWDGGPGGGKPDSQCVDAPWRNTEKSGSCGLGFELALVVPLLARLRRRQ